ncbi:hypothetical protein ACFLXT_04655 [Chloroflexota bacterium]
MTKALKPLCLSVVLLLLSLMVMSSPVLAEDGKLFMVDVYNSQIHELDPSTGAILNTIPTPETTGEADGLAYGNGRMFFTVWGETIYELSPSTGEVLNQFPGPALDIDALAFSCDSLYALEFVESTIHVLNPNTGSPVATLDPPVFLIGGGTFAGTRNSLFFTDFDTDPDTIYELNPQNGAVLNSFLAPVDSGNLLGLGFSSSRNTLFLADEDNLMIYEVNPNNGNIINFFEQPEGARASALAADECVVTPPTSVIVGGEIASESQAIILAPFIMLSVIILAQGYIPDTP